jgi:hypothetical protein
MWWIPDKSSGFDYAQTFGGARTFNFAAMAGALATSDGDISPSDLQRINVDVS